MAEALLSNMQICYIHSNIRASASAPVLRCCKVNIMITGYGCILHILITGGVINQGDCKSTEAVFRVYIGCKLQRYICIRRWSFVGAVFVFVFMMLVKKRREHWSVGDEITWRANIPPMRRTFGLPCLPVLLYLYFTFPPAVFLYLCTYLISLELHPDMYQIVKVREMHHNCSFSSLDLRRKHLKLESRISLVNNIWDILKITILQSMILSWLYCEIWTNFRWNNTT